MEISQDKLAFLGVSFRLQQQVLCAEINGIIIIFYVVLDVRCSCCLGFRICTQDDYV